MALTFKEIERKKYRTFDRMLDDKAKAHVEAVKYIETIARAAGVNISEWDAKAVFGTGNGNELQLERNIINQLFFEHMERLSVSTIVSEPAPRALLSEAQVAAIGIAEGRLLKSQIDNYTMTRDSRLQNANEHYRNYEMLLKQAAEADLARRKLSGERSTLVDQIKAIDEAGFWEFIGMDGNDGPIKFRTRRDINLEHINPAIGANVRVSMGKYQAAYDFKNAKIRVSPAENNINVDSHYHPHINATGEICWGTAGNAAAQALARSVIVEPMSLLGAVLAGYNPGSPYRTLERFHEQVVTPEEQAAVDALNKLRADTQVKILAANGGMTAIIDRVPQAIMPATNIPVEIITVTPAADTTGTVAIPQPQPATTNVETNF